jgi:hypothetical protein
METRDSDRLVIWGPDGCPMGWVSEFDTVTCQLKTYIREGERFRQGTRWKHPLDYANQATAIKFRPTPAGEMDSIIMTLPGAYATQWEPITGTSLAGSQPNPNAPRL